MLQQGTAWTRSAEDRDSSMALAVDRDSSMALAVDRDSSMALTVDRDSSMALAVDRDSSMALAVDRDSSMALAVDCFLQWKGTGKNRINSTERHKDSLPGSDGRRAVSFTVLAGRRHEDDVRLYPLLVGDIRMTSGCTYRW